MAWSKPKAREVKCGMEINMYGPAEDDRDARPEEGPAEQERLRPAGRRIPRVPRIGGLGPQRPPLPEPQRQRRHRDDPDETVDGPELLHRAHL